MGSSPDTGWAPSKSKNKPHFPLLLAKSKPHFPLPWGVYEYPSQGSAPTFADVLILQPELPLDLPVGIPDGAGFLKAIHCLLDVVVAKLVQQRHKISTGGGSIQRVKCIAEGWEGNGRDAQFPEPTKPLLPPYTLTIGNQALSPSPAKKGYVTSCHPFSPYSPVPAHLHWEMVIWLSRTWYITDCTFQCCRRGYPDTSLKFTMPATEKTQGLNATAEQYLTMGMAAALRALSNTARKVGRSQGKGLCTHHMPPGRHSELRVRWSPAIKMMSLKENT